MSESNDPVHDPTLRALLDEREIRAVLARYCRAVDRMDRALARGCWHVDGTAEYREMFEGDADALVAWIWSVHDRMATHSHQLANAIVRLAGDRARSETYVTASLRTRAPAGESIDIVNRGRYLDRWSKRDGTWAIDHRIYVNDMTSVSPAPERPPARTTGARDGTDPSHAHFASDATEGD